MTDYYEFLQISPNAERDTITRVYRYLATRFHPDNPETGNVEKFIVLARQKNLWVSSGSGSLPSE